MYRITKKFERGSEMEVAKFSSEEKATAEIMKHLAEDKRLNVKAVYFLYEGADRLQEWDQSKLKDEPASDSGQGQQQSSKSTFQPTPFNTTPRPKGSPQGWLKDEDDNKK